HKAMHVSTKRGVRQAAERFQQAHAPAGSTPAQAPTHPQLVRVQQELKKEKQRVASNGERPPTGRRKRKNPFLPKTVEVADGAPLGARADSVTVPIETIGYVIPS